MNIISSTTTSRFPIAQTSFAVLLIALLAFGVVVLDAQNCNAEIKVAELKRDTPVDFDKEILPVLQRNCLACHNKQDAENDLILETVDKILVGGVEGAAVVAGDPEKSPLFLLSTHRDEPIMPPEDNEVQAKPLTAGELALLKLWIEQGAKPSAQKKRAVQFEKLPPGINPVFALSLSPDGRHLAAGRANQVNVYSMAEKKEVARLTDPAMIKTGLYQNPGVAHLDIVQSVAFSPDNRTIATGGYKTIKIWQHDSGVDKTPVQLSGPPSMIAVSKDEKQIAIGYENGEIELRDATSGTVTRKLSGHKAAITSLDFDAAASQLLSASTDKSVRIWKTADGSTIGELAIASPVYAAIFAGSEKLIAIASDEKEIACYEIGALTGIKEKEHEKADEKEAAKKEPEPPKPAKKLAGHSAPTLRMIRLAEDGSTIMSASRDGNVRIWDINAARSTRQFNHGQSITDFALSPDGKTLATVGQSPSIKIWNATDGRMTFEMKGDIRSTLEKNQLTLATSLRQRRLDLAKQDVEEMKKRKTSEEENAKKTQGELGKTEQDLKTKVDAEKVAKEKRDKVNANLMARKKELTDNEANVTKTDAEIKKIEKTLAEKQAALNAAKAEATKQTQALAAAKAKLTGVENQLKQKLDDVELKKQVDASKNAVDAATKTEMAAQQQSKALETEVAAINKSLTDNRNALNKLNQTVASLKRTIQQETNSFTNVDRALETATDQRVAAERVVKNTKRTIERSNQAAKDAGVKIPQLETLVKQEEKAKLDADNVLKSSNEKAAQLQKKFASVAFTDDKTLVASNENGRLSTWNTDLGQPVSSFDLQRADQLHRVSNGGLVALQKTAKQFLRASIRDEWILVRTIGNIDSSEFSDRVTAIAFSPDGKQLATGGGEPSRGGELKIWNVENASLLREFPDAHSDTVLGVTFSPDGKQLASSSTDRFVKVFDVASGKLQVTCEGHTHHAMGVSWSADSRFLASAGADKSVKIWDAETGEQKRTITGFKKEVAGTRFVGVQNQVLAGSGEGLVQLSDAANGRQIRRFAGFAAFVHCVDTTSDGKLHAVGGNDGSIRVWQENGQLFAEFAQEKATTKDATAEK